MKCEDCECHEFVSACPHGQDGDYRERGHWCMYKIEYRFPAGHQGFYFGTLYIPYQDYKRVNKKEVKCPKTLKTVKVDGVDCEVISVGVGCKHW